MIDVFYIDKPTPAVGKWVVNISAFCLCPGKPGLVKAHSRDGQKVYVEYFDDEEKEGGSSESQPSFWRNI
jgi:hypothetical protein